MLFVLKQHVSFGFCFCFFVFFTFFPESESLHHLTLTFLKTAEGRVSAVESATSMTLKITGHMMSGLVCAQRSRHDDVKARLK